MKTKKNILKGGAKKTNNNKKSKKNNRETTFPGNVIQPLTEYIRKTYSIY